MRILLCCTALLAIAANTIAAPALSPLPVAINLNAADVQGHENFGDRTARQLVFGSYPAFGGGYGGYNGYSRYSRYSGYGGYGGYPLYGGYPYQSGYGGLGGYGGIGVGIGFGAGVGAGFYG